MHSLVRQILNWIRWRLPLGLASCSGAESCDVLARVLNPRMCWLIEFVNLLEDKVVGRLGNSCLKGFFFTELVVWFIVLGSTFLDILVKAWLGEIFLFQRRNVAVLVSLDTFADVHVDRLGGLLGGVEALIAWNSSPGNNHLHSLSSLIWSARSHQDRRATRYVCWAQTIGQGFWLVGFLDFEWFVWVVFHFRPFADNGALAEFSCKLWLNSVALRCFCAARKSFYRSWSYHELLAVSLTTLILIIRRCSYKTMAEHLAFFLQKVWWFSFDLQIFYVHFVLGLSALASSAFIAGLSVKLIG